MPPLSLICAYEAYGRRASSNRCRTRAHARRTRRSIERLAAMDGFRLP